VASLSAEPALIAMTKCIFDLTTGPAELVASTAHAVRSLPTDDIAAFLGGFTIRLIIHVALKTLAHVLPSEPKRHGIHLTLAP
jgi:hypothetical protein